MANLSPFYTSKYPHFARYHSPDSSLPAEDRATFQKSRLTLNIIILQHSQLPKIHLSPHYSTNIFYQPPLPGSSQDALPKPTLQNISILIFHAFYNVLCFIV